MAEKTVTIQLPIGKDDQAGYQTQLRDAGQVPLDERGTHLNLHLGPKAARILVRIRNGLRSKNAKLSDKKPVFSNADTIRYVFENLIESAAE